MKMSRSFAALAGSRRSEPIVSATVPVPYGERADGFFHDGRSGDYGAFQSPQFHGQPQGYAPFGAGQAGLAPDFSAHQPRFSPVHHPAGKDLVEGGPSFTAQARSIFHAFGAVLSVALIVGSGVWVWQLVQRDVSGVPVVRALEGPLRVAPQVPGGQQAAHQGLSVTQLAGAEEVEGAGELILAPTASEFRSDDVLPVLPAADPDPIPGPRDEADPILMALQQAVAAPRTDAPPLGLNSPSASAVARSPRPLARGQAASPMPAQAASDIMPASFAMDDLAASLASSVAQGFGARDIDIDPSTIAVGTRLVQLGAYDDVESAHRAWDALKQRFSPLLDERGRVVEAAQSGGSTFYRLRAHGFSDERDARRFCAALVDQQIDCIPVLVR